MLISLAVIIFALCVCVSNSHVMHLRYMTFILKVTFKEIKEDLQN